MRASTPRGWASKFAICFTFGSVLFNAAFGALLGPCAHLRGLFSADRALFSVVYVISIVMTLYACLVAKSTIQVIVFASVQIAALLWFLATYLPGGAVGMRYLSMLCMRTASTVAGGCLRACGLATA